MGEETSFCHRRRNEPTPRLTAQSLPVPCSFSGPRFDLLNDQNLITFRESTAIIPIFGHKRVTFMRSPKVILFFNLTPHHVIFFIFSLQTPTNWPHNACEFLVNFLALIMNFFDDEKLITFRKRTTIIPYFYHQECVSCVQTKLLNLTPHHENLCYFRSFGHLKNSGRVQRSKFRHFWNMSKHRK